jgi:hypothetical protein
LEFFISPEHSRRSVDPKRNPRAGGPFNPPGAAAQTPRPARPALGEALDQLNREVQQLRVDFERFFNGALPFPPEELRGRVQAQIRHLRGLSNGATAVDSFRLSDLEARFNSYNELFNRRLRDVEEGRHPAARPAPPPPPGVTIPRRGSSSATASIRRRPRRSTRASSPLRGTPPGSISTAFIPISRGR